MITQPKIEFRDEQTYAAVRTALTVPFTQNLPPLWGETAAWLAEQGCTSFGPAIIRYLTTNIPDKLEVEVGFLIAKGLRGDHRITAGSLPAGRYATLQYTGPYDGDGIYQANAALMQWGLENRVIWDTTSQDQIEWWRCRLEIYHNDPSIDLDPEKYRTELAFLIKE